MSLSHKLWFSNLYIFVTQCGRPQIFQTMNSVRWKNLSLKYQRFAPSGGKNIGIRKSEFVTKTQFLYMPSSEQNLYGFFLKATWKLVQQRHGEKLTKFYLFNLENDDNVDISFKYFNLGLTIPQPILQVLVLSHCIDKI